MKKYSRVSEISQFSCWGYFSLSHSAQASTNCIPILHETQLLAPSDANQSLRRRHKYNFDEVVDEWHFPLLYDAC